MKFPFLGFLNTAVIQNKKWCIFPPGLVFKFTKLPNIFLFYFPFTFWLLHKLVNIMRSFSAAVDLTLYRHLHKKLWRKTNKVKKPNTEMVLFRFFPLTWGVVHRFDDVFKKNFSSESKTRINILWCMCTYQPDTEGKRILMKRFQVWGILCNL